MACDLAETNGVDCFDYLCNGCQEDFNGAQAAYAEIDRLRALLREVAEKRCLNPTLQDRIEEVLRG
jgi:hypothetical protein